MKGKGQIFVGKIENIGVERENGSNCLACNREVDIFHVRFVVNVIEPMGVRRAHQIGVALFRDFLRAVDGMAKLAFDNDEQFPMGMRVQIGKGYVQPIEGGFCLRIGAGFAQGGFFNFFNRLEIRRRRFDIHNFSIAYFEKQVKKKKGYMAKVYN